MFIYQCTRCPYRWVDDRPPLCQPALDAYCRPVVDPYGRPILNWFYPPCPSCNSPEVTYLGQQVYRPPSAPVFSEPARMPALLTNSASPNGEAKGFNVNAKAFVPQSVQAQSAVATVTKVNDPFAVLHKEILKLVLCQLDRKAIKFVCQVSKRWSTFGVAFLRLFVPSLKAHGSAVSPIQPIIEFELKSARTLQLAVDQMPFSSYEKGGSLLEYIIKNRIQVKLLLGTKDDRTLDLLNRASKGAAQAIEDLHKIFSKMHNKIWVVDENAVITGSPNISWTAMKSNVESMIIIRNRDAASLFTRYIRLLESKTPTSGPDFQSLQQALVQYNREDRGLKLAMAPLMNIADFVIEQIEGATKIVVRQFLISPTEPGSGPDVLKVLCDFARNSVDVEVYIDENQYKSMGFVRLAVNALVGSGCKVYLQSLVTVVNASVENCVHDKLILAEIHGGIRKTLIGSAGFTTEVIANRNAENFICTDSRSVYDSLMAHHQKVINSPSHVHISRPMPRGQTPQWVQKKFTQDWLQEFM